MIRPAPLPFARGKWKIEYFRKTKNPESEHGNLPNERLDREKLFKHAFGVEGKNLRKYGSKLRTSAASDEFYCSYEKRLYNENTEG